MEGLAGTVDGTAVVAADLPAHELIPLGRVGHASHKDLRVIRIGIAIQLHVEGLILLALAQGAGQGHIAHGDDGIIGQVEVAHVHPA